MLELKNLKKAYGRSTALDVNNLHIEKGESFGLVGNNGAGKTTMFRLILDLIEPTAGEVRSKGKKVQGSEHWKSYTGSYLDERFLIDFLYPKEYFHFVGKLYGLSDYRTDAFLEPFRDFLGRDINDNHKLIRELSQGNRAKTGVIAALIGEPEVLVLDEPFAHLDPGTQIRLKSILRELHEQRDLCMLLSSHDLKQVTEVCGRIAILEEGKIVKDLETTPHTLRELENYFSN